MRDPLFNPITIGSMEVKNRIFMPAMHLNMCRDYMVTSQLTEFYRARARGGAGLISVGYATVDELSGNIGNIGAHDDRFIPGLTSLAEVIRQGGAKSAVQLNHAGRYNHSFFLGGKKPIAPSAIPSRLTRETPREMARDEIASVQMSFAEAAARVVESGFDMVEILAGTGYLISEFLSPLTNKRKDEYGGSLENRMRFGIETLRLVREIIGDFPLLVRINGNDFMEDGIGRNEMLAFARQLEHTGVDAICVNVGWHEAQVPQIVTKVPRGVFAYMAKELKEEVAIPVIASHRINDPTTARQLIGEHYCDMVAMGRALIADPELPNKTMANQEETILHCVACGQGCFDNLMKMKGVECLCNPVAGHEEEFSDTQTEQPKKVMVAGGGVAGINAAVAAAAKGHQVTLYEKSMILGGQLHLAGASPGRDEFLVLADDLIRKLESFAVEVVLGKEVDGELLIGERPDTLIIATGGKPLDSIITGSDMDHVVQAWDVLGGKTSTGKRVAIIGGGAVGVETALFLAEQGTLSGEELKFLMLNGAESMEELKRLAVKGTKEITLVEVQDKIGVNFGKSTRWSMLQDVDRYRVATLTESTVQEITPQGVMIERGGEEILVEADTIVLAVGTEPYNPLQKVAAELNILSKVVGDASTPATVMEATHQGFRAGMALS